jgi:hypothetical protein
MTPADYRAALATLGLSQQAAGRWLMVSPKTAQNYAKLQHHLAMGERKR